MINLYRSLDGKIDYNNSQVLVITVSLQGWLPLGCWEEERIALFHLKSKYFFI
jgi:hypothetical protein